MSHRPKQATLFLASIALGNLNIAYAQSTLQQSNSYWTSGNRITGRQSQTIEFRLNDRGSQLKPPPSTFIQPGNGSTSHTSGLSTTLGTTMNGSPDGGYFTVPNWFQAQPKPYERPQEFFRRQTEVSVSQGILGITLWSFADHPWFGGYRPWSFTPSLGGYVHLPFGYGANYSPWISPWILRNSLGSLIYPGYHRYWGGYTYSSGCSWGYPLGGGVFGFPGMPGIRVGSITSTAVSQSAPSKPSGNFYAPSNIDNSASGGYYADSAPYLVPIMTPKQAPKDYWGESGSPFPKDLNSTPWSK